MKTEQKLQQDRMKYFEEKLQAPDATKQQLECDWHSSSFTEK